MAQEGVREERVRLGQCPSCGQQLYLIEPTSSCCGLMGQGSVKKPLSVPQLVDRGQCVKCTSGGDPSKDFEHPLMNSLVQSPMDRCGRLDSGSVTSTDSSFKSKEKVDTSKSTAKNVGYTAHLKHPPPPQPPRNIPSIPLDNPSTQEEGATSTAIYSGPYNMSGQKHGEGTMTWSNGDSYQGQFVNDERHGMGTLTFAPKSPESADNGEYVGEWRHNQMHGDGTRRYANGDVYVGQYVQGKRHGEGRFYYANGDLYWGPWRDNHMHGTPGRYYYSSGQSFEGTFVSSRRTGKGKIQKMDGSIEIFQYVNDERVGQGVRWNSDRSKAWRLWIPRNTYSQPGVSNTMEKEPMKVADATRLMMDIEEASRRCLEDFAHTLN